MPIPFGVEAAQRATPGFSFIWQKVSDWTTMRSVQEVVAVWRMGVLVASAFTMLTLATPVVAASPNDEQPAQDAAQSVEILRGDQVEGEEKKEKPAPRGTCAWQCEKFRKQCEVYCKRQGRMPGMMSPTRNCREDCKQYKTACSRDCRGGSAFR